MCEAHYQQWRKIGRLKPIWENRLNIHTAEDLVKYAVYEGECLVWARSKTSSGYGNQTYKNKSWPAHRLMYFLSNGQPDLDGIVIHHKCANRLCINPEHLEPATQAANVLEMFSRTGLEAELKKAHERIAELEAEVETLKGRGVTILR